MRKFIAQSCAFLGTFRHSHAPLSPRFSLSLAHLCCLDFVAYARWAYVAGSAMCSLSLRAYAALRFVAYALRAYVAGSAMCSLSLRAYAPLAGLCAHSRSAHTPGFFSVPLRIRFCRQTLSFPSFFPFFYSPSTCGEARCCNANAFLYSIQRLRRSRHNLGTK